MFFSSLNSKKIGMLLFCFILILPLLFGIKNIYLYNITEPIKVHITTNEGNITSKHYPYLKIDGVDVKVDDDTFQNHSVGSHITLGINKIKNQDQIKKYLDLGLIQLLISLFTVSIASLLMQDEFFNKRDKKC